MPRAFVALDLPETLLDPLEGAARGLPCGKATPRENLHLTLAFLDDQPMPVLEELHGALSALRQPAPEVSLEALDLWGGKAPKLLVATLAGGEPLARLQAAVARAAREAGIDLPRRRFRPHVTLARFGKGEATERLSGWLAGHAPLAGASARAPGFTLWRSTLLRDGAFHEPLAEYAFP